MFGLYFLIICKISLYAVSLAMECEELRLWEMRVLMSRKMSLISKLSLTEQLQHSIFT